MKLAQRVKTLACLAVCLVVVAGWASGQGGKKFTLLTVTLLDASGDRIRSDGQGSYLGRISNGFFQLRYDISASQKSRALTLDFKDCEMGCTGPLDGTVILGTGFVSNNFDDVEAIPVGSTISDRFGMGFTSPDGEVWHLRFFGDRETCGADLPTGMVNITRDSETQWTMTAPAGAVACLLKATSAKGRTVLTPSGRFRMPFSLTFVTK